MKRSRLFHAIVVAGSAIPGEAPPVIAIPVVAAAVSTSGCWVGWKTIGETVGDLAYSEAVDLSQSWGVVDGPPLLPDLASVDGAASDQASRAIIDAGVDQSAADQALSSVDALIRDAGISPADSFATLSSDLKNDGGNK